MDVAAIQRALLARDYDLGPWGADGKMGEATKKAVRLFQVAHGITSTGVVDGATEKAILAPIEPKPAPALSSKILDKKSETNLIGVHPDLIKVVRRAAEIAAVAFRVTEGVRTPARQKQLLAAGASQTLRSRHIPSGSPSLGHAIDLAAVVGGSIRWDWPLYERLAVAMKQAAHDVGVPIEWGGDWTSFKDGPHFQLPWGRYP